MDLGRFYRAVQLLNIYYRESGVRARFDQLVNDLNALAGNPADTELANAFRQGLDTLQNEQNLAARDFAGGPVGELVTALRLGDYVGNGLTHSITETVSNNRLSPQLAAGALTKLKTEVDGVFDHLKAVDEAFAKLGIKQSELGEGESEISLDLPIASDEKTLADLAVEAKEWNQIIATLSEVFDDTRPRSSIRTLATGSWLIYLTSTPLVLWGVATALRRVNQILGELLKMKELIKQLASVNAPTQQVEEHQQRKLAGDLEQLAKELVEQNYKGTDSGRKMELVTATSIALKTLTRKIAAGARVGLRIAAPKKAKAPTGDTATPEENKLLLAVEKFSELKTKIDAEVAQISYVDGAKDLLASLPAPTNADAETGSSQDVQH